MEPTGLSTFTQEAWLRGRNVHGDLGLEPRIFDARLRQVIEKHTLPLSVLAEAEAEAAASKVLHVPDLYLAAACAQRTEQAWVRFSDLYRKKIQALCQWTWRDDSSSDAAQDILIDLYLPDRSGECRIGSYDGMSSLARWLRIIVTNRWLNHRKSSSARLTPLEEISVPVDTSAFGQIETIFAARRYEPQILLALSHACRESLSVDERLMVLLRFEQNLQLGEIGKLLQVHQSTVTRQMGRAMSRLRTSMIGQLIHRYGLSSEAVADCLEVLVDAIPQTFSILALLDGSGTSENPRKDAPLDRDIATPLERPC